MKVHKYDAPGISVSYEAARCIHAERCVHGLPKVFDAEAHPWIAPANASPQELAKVICQCPTGALHYQSATVPAEKPDAENAVFINADGPLYLRGDIRIKTQDGQAQWNDTRVALCRCGASANKPFCDLSHTKSGFADAGMPPRQNGGNAPAPGPLELTLAADGPVLFKGAVAVKDASGNIAVRMEAGAFCRCGASANKPFCDGSHTRVGFKS
jgi:CDGSH-type Zn-finger protein/uncharacterized Fe-S cluster protein YjdI